MIPALIDIHNEVAEATQRRGGALAVFDYGVEIEIEKGKLLVGVRHEPMMAVCSKQAKNRSCMRSPCLGIDAERMHKLKPSS